MWQKYPIQKKSTWEFSLIVDLFSIGKKRKFLNINYLLKYDFIRWQYISNDVSFDSYYNLLTVQHLFVYFHSMPKNRWKCDALFLRFHWKYSPAFSALSGTVSYVYDPNGETLVLHVRHLLAPLIRVLHVPEAYSN